MACLGTMSACSSIHMWITFLMFVHGITIGKTYSEVDRCISNNDFDTTILKTEMCVASKNDIEITCPPNNVIILVSLKFGLKSDVSVCTKRVLATRDAYCCKVRHNDALYQDRCLQDVWSSEDRQHYRQFMQQALQKCRDTNYCTLNWEMFSNLQRKLPTTQKYASYIQVENHCLKAPAHPIDICSSTSEYGKQIHIQGSFTSRDNSNKNCSCRVTSKSPVTVRAVDVRTYNSRLILRSDNRVKDIISDQLPMFGLREIFTDRVFSIMLQNVSDNINGYLWIMISGSSGNDVNIVCGDYKPIGTDQTEVDHAPKVKNIQREPETDQVTTKQHKSGYKGSTLMIYAGVGSGLTLILTAFIFGCYFICRYCTKKGNKRHQYENPYPSHIPGQYDAVYDSLPHRSDHVIAPEWGNVDMKQNQRTSTMRSLHKPMAPTLPPPNKHGLIPSDHTQLPHNPMTASTTSDFDAFLGT